MSALVVVLAVAASLFALRLAGLAAPQVRIPPAWDRTLAFVPVSVLAALAVTGFAGEARLGMAPFVAAAGAVVAGRRTGRMWVSIVVGIAVFAILGAV